MCAVDVAGQRMVVQPFAAWGKILIITMMIAETGHTLSLLGATHRSQPQPPFPSLPIVRGHGGFASGGNCKIFLLTCLQ